MGFGVIAADAPDVHRYGRQVSKDLRSASWTELNYTLIFAILQEINLRATEWNNIGIPEILLCKSVVEENESG